jgi:ATP-dependent RNA helicase SUPV3L1/SUV3
MNSNSENKNEIKLIPEMLNLLGCSKDNFIKLIQKMNYKTFKKNNETYFKYVPIKTFKKNHQFKSNKKDNPFIILEQMSFK